MNLNCKAFKWKSLISLCVVTIVAFTFYSLQLTSPQENFAPLDWLKNINYRKSVLIWGVGTPLGLNQTHEALLLYNKLAFPGKKPELSTIGHVVAVDSFDNGCPCEEISEFLCNETQYYNSRTADHLIHFEKSFKNLVIHTQKEFCDIPLLHYLLNSHKKVSSMLYVIKTLPSPWDFATFSSCKTFVNPAPRYFSQQLSCFSRTVSFLSKT
eukprot:Sdes_comp15057_c0_seq1m3835